MRSVSAVRSASSWPSPRLANGVRISVIAWRIVVVQVRGRLPVQLYVHALARAGHVQGLVHAAAQVVRHLDLGGQLVGQVAQHERVEDLLVLLRQQIPLCGKAFRHLAGCDRHRLRALRARHRDRQDVRGTLGDHVVAAGQGGLQRLQVASTVSSETPSRGFAVSTVNASAGSSARPPAPLPATRRRRPVRRGSVAGQRLPARSVPRSSSRWCRSASGTCLP